MLSTAEAIKKLLADPAHAALVRNTYLDADVTEAAARFGQSGEWQAVLGVLGDRVRGARIVDVGAGNGMVSRAFALSGAADVIALEPDPSDHIGRGAIQQVCAGQPVQIIDAFAEALPLPDRSADIVYARQVLHHTRDLGRALEECARILKPGGLFLACREHVADTPAELAEFLVNHPVHQLTGGEHAFRLNEYRHAVRSAGLVLRREIGPWDSVINAFPAITSDAELPGLPARIVGQKYGPVGRVLAQVPGIAALVRRRLFRPRPGRLHTFFAQKP